MTTDPTTPRPTDAAIALFRDALTGDGMYYLLNDYVHGADVTRADIARALLAHPTLARVIAIGQAWVAAEGDWVLTLSEDASPGPWGREGWVVNSPIGPVADDLDGFLRKADIRFAVAASNLVLALAAALADQERGS